MLECKQSQIQQFFQIQGQITPDVPIRFVPKSNSSETLWAYIVAKFGTDWSIFADARV